MLFTEGCISFDFWYVLGLGKVGCFVGSFCLVVLLMVLASRPL